MKLTGILILVAFLVGSCMGSGLSDSSEVEFIEVPRTRIIHEPAPPPEQLTVFPKACKELVELAVGITRHAEAIYRSGQKQIDILADARLYLAAQRNTKDIDERQRRLHGQTVGDLFDLEKLLFQYESAKIECEK